MLDDDGASHQINVSEGDGMELEAIDAMILVHNNILRELKTRKTILQRKVNT